MNTCTSHIKAPIDATTTDAWKKLQKHFDELQAQGIDLRSWFKDNPQRVEKYSYEVNDLHFDLSKNLIDDTTKQLLCELAQELGIEQRRDDMFSGKHLNTCLLYTSPSPRD